MFRLRLVIAKMLRYWLCFASALCLAGYCDANYCRDANLCCPGRDSSCVVQKAHQNAIIEDKPCYCDHACLKLGDCCPDFRETCGGKAFDFYSIVRRDCSQFATYIKIYLTLYVTNRITEIQISVF